MEENIFKKHIVRKQILQKITDAKIDSQAAPRALCYNIERFFRENTNLIDSYKAPQLIVSLFYPIGRELNPLGCMDFLRSFNAIACLPVVQKDSYLLFKEFQGVSNLKPAVFNTKEPDNDLFCIPNIILAPLVAYDDNGTRLGYGKGYYDKTLAYYKSINHKALYIGLAHSIQKHNFLPKYEHDIPLNGIITEENYKLYSNT